jgi:gamma-glutamylcyclotransferase
MPSDDEVLVFSYGSNMLSARIQERCPSAQAVGVATLARYELAWHKRSRDGSGKCDVVPCGAESVVWGVVFRVPHSEKRALDRAEGLGQGYEERTVVVSLNDCRTEVVLYAATDVDPALRPYTWYLELVLAGAREHRLPADYVARLVAVDSGDDPDTKRHAQNMALIPGGTKR